MPVELAAFLQWFGGASGGAVGVLFCYGVYSGRLVLRRELDREKADCLYQKQQAEFWQAKALDAIAVAGRAAEVAQAAVKTTERAIDSRPAKR